METEAPDIAKTDPPASAKRRKLKDVFTRKEWTLIWTTVLGTLSFVAVTAGPLVYWLLQIKDAQIQSLQTGGDTNLVATLSGMQTTLARLGMAFPVSTFDGKVAMGNGMSGKATPITDLLIESQDLIASNHLDSAEERLEAIDKIWPDFPGATLFRFEILCKKGDGYKKEAEAMADKAIGTLVDNVDVLKPAYGFSINEKLNRGDKAAAEKLMLNMLRRYSGETNIVTEFKRLFGYTPSTKKP